MVFANAQSVTEDPQSADVEGFRMFFARFMQALRDVAGRPYDEIPLDELFVQRRDHFAHLVDFRADLRPILCERCHMFFARFMQALPVERTAVECMPIGAE